MIWSGRPAYRWWHSPWLAYDVMALLAASICGGVVAALLLAEHGVAATLLPGMLAGGFGFAAADEGNRRYQDRRQRRYVLTRAHLPEHGVDGTGRAYLQAIAHLCIRRHRDGTGTIHYEIKSGIRGELKRLEDAEIVYLLLREYISQAIRAQA